MKKNKTEFTDIIKIEKNKLQTLEKELQNNFSLINNFSEQMEQLNSDILEIEYPISGAFSMLQQYNFAMHNMKNDVKKLSNERDLAGKKVVQIRKKMIVVNMEIEKFKFLEDEILRKRREAIFKAESKELDEIATILYSVNRG